MSKAIKPIKPKKTLPQFLKEHGTTSKDFAEWLDQTEVGVCKKFQRGVTKTLRNDLIMFITELKGITIGIDGLDFITIKSKAK